MLNVCGSHLKEKYAQLVSGSNITDSWGGKGTDTTTSDDVFPGDDIPSFVYIYNNLRP